MDPKTSSSLEQQIAQLTSRIYRLEVALQRQGIALQEAETPSRSAQETPLIVASAETTEPASAALPTVNQSPAAALPRLGFLESASRQDDHSLESRIGSQWFNRIGIVAILIGMAWFLKLAFDNHWIGNLGRVAIGLIAGAGLITWSERFHRHGYAAFSYSLKSVGSGTLYLSLWAAFSLYHLVPSAAAFAAMILVTAFNGFMAWMQDSELLALYAIVGGLATPLLLSTGENHEIVLLSYLLMLNIGALALVVLRPWSRLLFIIFAGTVFFFAGWWSEFYSDSQSGRTGFFVGCFFLIFAFAPRLVLVQFRVTRDDDTTFSAWDNLALVLLPIANAALGFIAFYVILDTSRTAWAGPWLAVGFAAFYLVLLRLPARGPLHISPSLLSGLHLCAVVVFLAIAIPLKAHGRWLTIGWLVQGAAMLWIAARMRSSLLRVLALLCLGLGLATLLVVIPPASITPILNQRFGTYCVAIAVFASVIWISKQARSTEDLSSPPEWNEIAAVASVAVNGLILLALGLEIHNYWWRLHKPDDWRLVNEYRIYAQFTYSALFMAFGAILLCLGFWRRSAYVRWQALILLAVSIGKVFLVDVSQLSQGYRILILIGLGALLLAVSFVYQRDWLGLRNHEQQTP